MPLMQCHCLHVSMFACAFRRSFLRIGQPVAQAAQESHSDADPTKGELSVEERLQPRDRSRHNHRVGIVH